MNSGDFSLGKQARFTSNSCSGMPPGKVHELAFLWFGMPGRLVTLNPTPATRYNRKQKLHCNFRKVALQKLNCNIRFSAVRTSFLPKAALQQTKNCTATLKKLHCKKVPLSCRFQDPTFRLPRLGPADFIVPTSFGPYHPKGPKIEKHQSRLKFPVSLENFNLD